MAKVRCGTNKGKEDELVAWGLKWVELKKFGPYSVLSVKFTHLEMERMQNSKRSPFNNKGYLVSNLYDGFHDVNKIPGSYR